jgi:hypothetical protein
MYYQVQRTDGKIEIELEIDWAQGEGLVKQMMKSIGGRIVDRAQGPDARTWFVQAEYTEFVVYQWDTGSFAVVFGEHADAGMIEKVEQAIAAAE